MGQDPRIEGRKGFTIECTNVHIYINTVVSIVPKYMNTFTDMCKGRRIWKLVGGKRKEIVKL